MGYEMIQQKIAGIEGFPPVLASEVGHCILSHHGELEYGSPKKPCIMEAVALSMADNMDAKMETFKEALEAKDTNEWLGLTGGWMQISKRHCRGKCEKRI